MALCGENKYIAIEACVCQAASLCTCRGTRILEVTRVSIKNQVVYHMQGMAVDDCLRVTRDADAVVGRSPFAGNTAVTVYVTLAADGRQRPA